MNKPGANASGAAVGLVRSFWRAAACFSLAILVTGCSPRIKAPLILAEPLASSRPSASLSSKASQSGPTFVDVASEAGLSYRWEILGKRPLTILQTIGNGCAFLDYDNDGNLDILLVGPRLALYKGDGKGRFTDSTEPTGLDKLSGHFLGCAVGDYDNDGYDDVYVSAYRGGVLLHNQGGVRFEDATQRAGIAPQPWGTSCTFTDVDADGNLDLYICGYAKFGPQTVPQLCEYSGRMSACGPRFYMPERGALYHNEGDGRFKEVTGASGMLAVSGKGLGVAAADFDGSGRPGLAIANDEMPGDLMVSRSGTFQNIGAKSGTAYDNSGNIHGGMGIDWGDYDNDGKLDLVVATFQHEAKCLYHNDGGGMFTESSANVGLADKTIPNVAFGVKFLDVDNDGLLDLVLANGHVQDNIASIDKTTTYRQPTQLFHNRHGDTYEDVSGQAGDAFRQNIVGRGLAVGDYDNDGRVDILVVDSEGAPMLLHNTTAQVGHWLSVKLVGKKSNRNGYGATVTVETPESKRMRFCQTDGSYLSASDRRVHVGLRSAASVTVTVRWPGGRTEVHKGLKVDRIITLTEGAP